MTVLFILDALTVVTVLLPHGALTTVVAVAGLPKNPPPGFSTVVTVLLPQGALTLVKVLLTPGPATIVF